MSPKRAAVSTFERELKNMCEASYAKIVAKGGFSFEDSMEPNRTVDSWPKY
jgi:hypothetical protein